MGLSLFLRPLFRCGLLIPGQRVRRRALRRGVHAVSYTHLDVYKRQVLSSSGTDIYSAISAAVGSLKGPRHGGANKKVMEMFHYIRKNVKDWKDDGEVSA